MALGVRIKPCAQREIERAAEWWANNRPAALGAIRNDIEAAFALLVEEPGIGTKIQTARADVVRRLYLTRVRYFLYYRVRGKFIEVVAFRLLEGAIAQRLLPWTLGAPDHILCAGRKSAEFRQVLSLHHD